MFHRQNLIDDDSDYGDEPGTEQRKKNTGKLVIFKFYF